MNKHRLIDAVLAAATTIAVASVECVAADQIWVLITDVRYRALVDDA